MTVTDHYSNMSDPGSPHNVSLTGVGSNLTLDAKFSEIWNGHYRTKSPKLNATLKNVGTSGIAINSVTGSLGRLHSVHDMSNPGTLAAGASCTLSGTFTPSAAGTRFGTITVTVTILQVRRCWA